MTTWQSPIQNPVTGSEDLGDHTQPLQALAQFYHALNSRDMEMMRQNWQNSAEAAMDNPLGGIKRGWEEIESVYQRLFESPYEYRFEFWDYTMHIAGDIFYVVGRERGSVNIGSRILQLAIRTSRIFRRDETGVWKQVHHHGSIDDPKMLAEYQQAVLRRT